MDFIASEGPTTETLKSIVGSNPIYTARRPEFETNSSVPFRVAPLPFELNREQRLQIDQLGSDITSYFKVIDQIYRSDNRMRSILDTGKPEIFLLNQPMEYLFVRPDLIITPRGFSLCEIETSPFGLALAEMLNRTYTQQGHETMISDGTLPNYVKAHTPTEGTLIYTNKTSSYKGQLTFLADEVFSGEGRRWKERRVDQMNQSSYPQQGQSFYRGLYLAEYMADPDVKNLLEGALNSQETIFPSLTPHMEEKAILSFLWDSRFECDVRKQLGNAAFNHLRSVVPPTWIVGQEEFFSPGMPQGITTSVELASLSRSKRTFVLKESGFSAHSSWAEGVEFLHNLSSDKAGALLRQAQSTRNALFVVQKFTKPANIPMSYEKNGRIEVAKNTRLRLTPYFSMGAKSGQLLGIKITGCENADLVHASSTSINAGVH